MKTIRRTASATRGSSSSAVATLVSGPTGTRVTSPGEAMTVSTMSSAARPGRTASRDVGRGTSRHSSWASGSSRRARRKAVTSARSRISARAAPAWTGTSGRPSASRAASVEGTASSSSTFPWTTVSASRESSGLPSAKAMASTSSTSAPGMPALGSVSRITRSGGALIRCDRYAA